MQLSTPALAQLYEDWIRWRGQRKFPAHDVLDPLELKYMLGNLWLIDVSYNPVSFKVRIHASARAERMGFDLTGKSLDELPDEGYREWMRSGLIEVLKTRAPHFVIVEPASLVKSFGRVETLILPFSSDGQTIDLIAAGTHLALTAPRPFQSPAHRDTA